MSPVPIDVQVAALRRIVQAAHEEMYQAISYHEAWRPMAYDKALHERMGTSYATNTFEIVRLALRREMLLALMRMWDRDDRAVGMGAVLRALSDPAIVDALVAEVEEHWLNAQPQLLRHPEDTAEEAAESARLYKEHRTREAKEWSGKTLDTILAARELILKYEPGGSGHETLKALRQLRNQHLAHRQVEPSAPTADKRSEADIEEFFQDMLELSRLLRLGVEHTDYRPEETASIQRRHAELFWRGVRGERTEGHPDYKPSPVRRPR
jgi:hypothetical protein